MTLARIQTARERTSGLSWQVPYEEPIIPAMLSRAAGCRLIDVDGHEYLDCDMGYGTAILGHAHPLVAAAVHEALDRGMSAGHCFEQQAELAALVKSANQHIERVAFFNSGSDAVTAAIRLVRARTGKSRIVRFDGCYHGWDDFLLYNTTPVLSQRGIKTHGAITAEAATAGVDRALAADVLVLPYGDAGALADQISRHRSEIGGILINPFPPFMWNEEQRACDFVSAVHRLARDANVPLIFDELGTGFRLARGGAQEKFGVVADLTCYGKLVAGAGLGLAILAGTSEYLDLARLDESSGAKAWVHSTHVGSYLPIVAALAQLSLLLRDFDAVCAHRAGAFRHVLDGVNALGRRVGIPLTLHGHALMHGTLGLMKHDSGRGENISSGSRFAKAATWYLRFNGVHTRAYPTVQLSHAHQQADIEELLASAEKAMIGLRADGVQVL